MRAVFIWSSGRSAPATTRRLPRVRDHVVPLLALASVAAFLAWPLANPHPAPATAYVLTATSDSVEDGLLITGQGGQIIRDGQWSVEEPEFPAPATGIPDPGTAKALARDMLIAQGLPESEYQCLHALWMRESGWNHFAQNRSSGAYGIPQALPASKMASAGADWATNPETQIRWGLGYISARYKTPCAAWAHSEQKNWY